MINIGIIGTAGRGENPAPVWDWAYNEVHKILLWVFHNVDPCITLVSGGAAWADSIAPHLFTHHNTDSGDAGFITNLLLYLPATFNNGRFEAPTVFTEKNAATIANYYHEKAVRDGCPWNGLGELSDLLEAGPVRDQLALRTFSYECRGYTSDFFRRNTMVAHDCDAIIALTFGGGVGVKDGGTMDTVQKFLSRGVKPHVTHIDLSTREVYRANPARLTAG